MIRPTFVGEGFKVFTDCTTWNGGGSNPYLTQVLVNFTPYAGYSFKEGDVAVAIVKNGMYPTQIGWQKIVDSTYADIWVKRLTSLVDNFNSYWSHPDGGYSLFNSGMASLVYRSPYQLDALYYASNETLQTINATASTVAFPAVSRSSFDDSDFYYRFDAVRMWEEWGTYYSNGVDYPSISPSYADIAISSTYCANTYEFISTPPETVSLKIFGSSNLSGTGLNAYVQSWWSPGSYSTYPIRVATTTLWIRGWNPSSQGVML